MPDTTGRVESKSHANTLCACRNCIVLEFTNHGIYVYPFCDKLSLMKLVPIALVATPASDINGEEVILVIHVALCFGQRMDHTLLSSNQVCAYNGLVFEGGVFGWSSTWPLN